MGMCPQLQHGTFIPFVTPINEFAKTERSYGLKIPWTPCLPWLKNFL